MRFRVRGWSGNRTGNRLDVSSNAVKIDSKFSRTSTFDGRCSVASANSPGRRPKRSQARDRAGPFEVRQERVNHHVADEHDSLWLDSRAREVGDARRLGDEEPVGQRVGDDAVQLLGHRAVEAPQARLDVREGQAEFRRHECRRHGRRHIADDDNPIRAQIEQHRFQPPQNFGRLRDGTSRADSQVGNRRRNLQFAEEGLAHPLVVVLPGVHDWPPPRRAPPRPARRAPPS